MPQSEMRALVGEVEDRVEGSGSYTTELPFGVLVNVLERPSGVIQEVDEDVEKDTIFVARREMVEFEVVLEGDEEEQMGLESDGEDLLQGSMASEVKSLSPHKPKAEGHGNVLVEAKLLPATQKWFVG